MGNNFIAKPDCLSRFLPTKDIFDERWIGGDQWQFKCVGDGGKRADAGD